MRPNGLPALRDLPITFKRRLAVAPGFEKLVGKETDRKKHSPYEYASADGRWVIRSTQHTGYGTSHSGRVRWHVSLDGGYFRVGFSSSNYTLSLEDAVDDIHRQIGRGLCEGFEVLAKIRQTAKAAEQAEAKRLNDLTKARGLVERLYGTDPDRLSAAIAAHLDLDALTRAIDSACRKDS